MKIIYVKCDDVEVVKKYYYGFSFVAEGSLIEVHSADEYYYHFSRFL